MGNHTPPRPPPRSLIPPPAPVRPRPAGPAGRGHPILPPLVFGSGSPPGGSPGRRTRKQKQRKQQTRKQKQRKH